jgi:hypothetical protein
VPKGKHDDLADVTSMGLIFLRENGMLTLTREHIENTLRQRVWTGRKETVAEQYGV